MSCSGWGSLLWHRSLLTWANLTDPNWTNTKRFGRATRTTVLSETRHAAGLLLFRVLRGGLRLCKYLGKTAGRAKRKERDFPSHPRPGSSSRWQGERTPRRGLGTPGVSWSIPSDSSDQSVLLSSTVAERWPRASGRGSRAPAVRPSLRRADDDTRSAADLAVLWRRWPHS